MNISQNNIVNVNALSSFFSQLKNIESNSNTVSIVHIGDSHIQADFLSGEVRQKLQASFGNAGRGFVFPYKIAKSGGALDVRFSYTGSWQSCYIKRGYSTCNLGVSGFTITPGIGASFKIDVAAKAQTDATFNKLTFLDNYGSFLPTSALGGFSPIKEKGNTVIYFDELQEKIEFKPAFEKNIMPELQGMILENGEPGVLYHGIGINGSTVSQYLRSNSFEKQINDLDASLVIISFGTNDCYTSSSKFCANCLKEDYRKLIARIRSKNPSTPILLTTPPDHFLNRKYANKKVIDLNNALYELAAEEEVALWDLHEAMGGAGSILSWKNEGLATSDLVHFTIPGYKLQGDLLYKALMRGYDSQ